MASSNPFARVRALARNSPWVVMAVLIHVVVIATLSVMYMGHKRQHVDEERTSIAIARPQEPRIDDFVQPPEPIDRRAVPKNDDVEVVPDDRDIVYVPQTEPQPDPDLHQERGNPNSIDNLPSGGSPGGSATGAGLNGHFGGGVPSVFGGTRLGPGGKGPPGRNDGKETQGTQRAVLEGLRWLARHQNKDGSWSAAALREHCDPDAPCADPKANFTDNYDAGLTGLALLAFLGSGYAHDAKQDIVDPIGGKRYKAGEIVKSGVKWLVAHQNADGSFSKGKTFVYNDALATLALAEDYGLTKATSTYCREPAQRGVDFLQHAQRPSPMQPNGLWGWRYAARMEIEDPRRETADANYAKELFDADTSATGWAVMALKSAQLCGLKVKKESMDGAFEFAKYVTADNGLVGYVDAKTAGSPVQGPNDFFAYHAASMSALGMCIRIFTQHDPSDPFLKLAAQRVIADLPSISKDKLSVDYYYWYYGSLALNQFDGPDSPARSGKFWGPWNKAMVDALLALQDHKDKACSNGGWVVPDRWAHAGGPIYATAINTLTLEVYYRYENAFGGAKRN
jgi:hypothetical protein